ncbi:hypothetical protein SO802_016043 [Lithocarpus litseifolius]|uniref:Uncharacterized protein n=1 Tax=Lithocarpus litseifolius TaxID=425828 RepID=A0AAW2CVZ7_9ROSI
MMNDQKKMLEQIRACLTRLEEGRNKRPIGEEEEEDMEDWDKNDRAEYKKKKKYEKLTADTLAKKEKMEKKQLAFWVDPNDLIMRDETCEIESSDRVQPSRLEAIVESREWNHKGDEICQAI